MICIVKKTSKKQQQLTMSQLQFQVSIVGANSQTKVTVPPEIGLSATAGSPSSFSSSPSGRSQYQLPCSPIAPARIILKNTEKFPIYFKVFTDRPSSASSSASPTRKSKSGDDSGEEQQQLLQQQQKVFIHPTRGAVKPNKSMTIAVVLAPPPNPTERTLSPSAAPRNSRRSGGGGANNAARRSNTPKRVSFANTGDEEYYYYDSDNGDETSLSSPTQQPGNEYHPTLSDLNKQPIVRMKIESVVILSGNNTFVKDSHFVHNHDDSDDDNIGHHHDTTLTRTLDANDPSSFTASATTLHPRHHHCQEQLISKHEFDRQWNQGVRVPSRIFDVVSVRPAVSRDQYLHYSVTRKIHRCDRLARRCEATENHCKNLMRLIEDLKEADVKERTKELLMESGTVTNIIAAATGDRNNRNAFMYTASIHIFSFAIGMIASFAAGFSL